MVRFAGGLPRSAHEFLQIEYRDIFILNFELACEIIRTLGCGRKHLSGRQFAFTIYGDRAGFLVLSERPLGDSSKTDAPTILVPHKTGATSYTGTIRPRLTITPAIGGEA